MRLAVPRVAMLRMAWEVGGALVLSALIGSLRRSSSGLLGEPMAVTSALLLHRLPLHRFPLRWHGCRGRGVVVVASVPLLLLR